MNSSQYRAFLALMSVLVGMTAIIAIIIQPVYSYLANIATFIIISEWVVTGLEWKWEKEEENKLSQKGGSDTEKPYPVQVQ
jgi:uncharacterized membrane protein YqjE